MQDAMNYQILMILLEICKKDIFKKLRTGSLMQGNSVETESDSGSGIRIPFHDLGLIRIFFSRFGSGIRQ